MKAWAECCFVLRMLYAITVLTVIYDKCILLGTGIVERCIVPAIHLGDSQLHSLLPPPGTSHQLNLKNDALENNYIIVGMHD